MPRMKVVISSEPRLLSLLRAAVCHCAQAAGFALQDADCLAMAVDEAASNVIRHTYGGRTQSRVTLEIVSHPDRIEFVLEDSGPKVQPCAIHPRPLDEIRPGGLGTHFIRCFVDVISYDESFAGGNRLRLTKYLPGKGTPRHEGSSSQRR